MVFGLALVEVLSLLAVCLYLQTSTLSGAYPMFLPVASASAIALCCLVAFYYNELYNLRMVRSYGEFVPRLIRSILAVLIVAAVFHMLFPRAGIDNDLFLTLVTVAALILWIRAGFYILLARGLLNQRVLILGKGPLAYRIAEEIERAPHLRYTTLGFVDDSPETSEIQEPAPELGGYRILGRMEQLSKIIDSLRPNRIVVALTERRGRLPVWKLLDSSVNGVPVEDGIEVFERLTGKVALESLAPSSIVFSSDFRKSRWRLGVIRTLNILASFVGIVLLAPVLFLVAVAIKLDSSGPVFFIQKRLGLRNKSFSLIKFRTMHATRGRRTSEWAEDNKARLTRIGPWLRKYRFDELPQLFNVLWGHMSLIGPRPHPVSNHELFLENISYYPLRAVIRPGITGWAQVRYGYANNLEEEREKMRYDLHYIKRMSFYMDFQILLDTVKCVLFGSESLLRQREQTPPTRAYPASVSPYPTATFWEPPASTRYSSHFREGRPLDVSSQRAATKPSTLL